LEISIIDHAHDGGLRQDGAAIIFLDDFLSWDCEMRVSEIKYALTWFFGSAHSYLWCILPWTRVVPTERPLNLQQQPMVCGSLYGMVPTATIA
jgi:hypothetical protein